MFCDPKNIILALDFSEKKQALALIDQIDPQDCRLKIGKEMFCRFGPDFVKECQQRGFEIFLDLKFHDIPTTVARACQAAADLGVWMLNVHAQGGRKMLEAARLALESYHKDKPLLIAVTLLTHLEAADLVDLGLDGEPLDWVKRYAILAQEAGLDGIVSSAQEVPSLKKHLSSSFLYITPGIRFEEKSQDDQKRIVLPGEALRLGVNYLVIGRPITTAQDPLHKLQYLKQLLKMEVTNS